MTEQGAVLQEHVITFRVLTVGELDTVDPGEHRLSELKRRSLRNNPLAQPEDPTVVHAFVRGEFAARLHLLPGELCFAGQRARCFFGSDFFSEPRFRSQGVGGLVLKKALSVVKAPFIVCGVTREALKAYQAAGMVHLGQIPHYIAPLRSGPFLRHMMCTSMMVPLADTILRVGSKLAWKRLMDAAQFYRLEEVSLFDSCLDELGQRFSSAFWFPRGSAYLNWVLRYPWNPHREKFDVRAYLIWSLRPQVHLPDGAMLLRFARPSPDVIPNMYSALLVDYFVRPDSERVVPALLGHALAEAKRADCDVLEVGGSDPALNDICRSSWMRRSGGFDLLCKPYRLSSNGEQIPGVLPSALTEARLTLGEGDMIFC